MPLAGSPMLSRMRVDLVRGHDLADLILDLPEDTLGLFDARALGRADVQAHLTGVDVGKEVLAHHRAPGRATRSRTRQTGRATIAAVCEAPVESAPVIACRIVSKWWLNAWMRQINPSPWRVLAFAPLIDLDLGPQQKVHHGGHQRSREEVRRQHGEDHGHARAE